MIENITSQQAMPEVKVKKMGKSVKRKASMMVRGVATRQATAGVEVKVTSSEKPDTEARPGDMSMKREVSRSTAVKEVVQGVG